MKNILLAVIIICITSVSAPSFALTSTEIEKQSLADSQVMLDAFKKKKIPVCIVASCKDNKAIENRILSAISKKLRDLGDIQVQDKPEHAAFCIKIVAVYNEPINQVVMSIVLTVNSNSCRVLFDKTATKEHPFDVYLLQWVGYNSKNNFSSNINEIIEKIDVESFQYFRKVTQ